MSCQSKLYASCFLISIFFVGCTADEPNAGQRDRSTKISDHALEYADQKIELVRFTMPDGDKSFLIGKYEITNDQYEAFLKASGYDGSDFPSSKKQEPFFYNWRKDPEFTAYLNGVPKGEGNHPACYLNWYHANAFCKWLSERSGIAVRLPTEKEWQFVAGGKDGRTYPWGNEWDSKRCNFAGDSDGFAKSAPVGSFPTGATPEDVHDMAGNIWEWSNDKTLMGGPWCLAPEQMKTNIAAKEDPQQANDKFGFRILVEME